MSTALHFDTVIVGSGLAGLSLALQLNPKLRIAIVTKHDLGAGASYWAQGGVAAAQSNTLDLEQHVSDTLKTGAGLSDSAVTQQLLSKGSDVVDWLCEVGVPFTRDSDTGSLNLTQEGGHTARRIVYADDKTGFAIQNTLIEQVKHRENITVFHHSIGVDLIVAHKQSPDKAYVKGLYIQNIQSTEIVPVLANSTVLATGGASKVYLYNTNPNVASGDGIAMAWRAGCSVANMEFNQFHPTCLYHPKAKTLLLSEAIRGEGGILLRPNGERFMHHYHPQLELAPRDIVARAIDNEMKTLGVPCLYLDISHKPAAYVRERFPTITQRCLEYGIDITQEPIPIVPAAHYTCGGIVTDAKGQTQLPRLFVLGEAACTGLHGANRLASNSLLECVAMSFLAKPAIENTILEPLVDKNVAPWDDSRAVSSDERVVIMHNWDELRRFMWDYVGIVRTTKRLHRAYHRIQLLQKEIREYYWQYRVTPDALELRNLADIAHLIVMSALIRKESRGLHYTRDYPETNQYYDNKPTVLDPSTIIPVTECV